jgi:hypothetical protein
MTALSSDFLPLQGMDCEDNPNYHRTQRHCQLFGKYGNCLLWDFHAVPQNELFMVDGPNGTLQNGTQHFWKILVQYMCCRIRI